MSDEVTGYATRRRSLLPVLLLVLLAFVAGSAAMGWVLANWSTAASYIGIRPAAPVQQPVRIAAPPAAQVPAASSAAPVPAGAEPQRLVIDPETTRRVAQLEQRVSQIDFQTRSAAGNADRAEGLLVAFAARRALDRGVPLGYIESLLRQRFGDTQREAVATIITASRSPVTLQELQDELQTVGPTLTGGGPRQNWWTALRTELGELVSIRKAGTPSTIPADRLRRASRWLEGGQVDVALAEILRLPARENAADWIEKARRYVAARRALDAIETAALLEPRPKPANTAAAAAALPAPAAPSTIK